MTKQPTELASAPTSTLQITDSDMRISALVWAAEHGKEYGEAPPTVVARAKAYYEFLRGDTG